jgi:Mannosyltransferase (PIG-V)
MAIVALSVAISGGFRILVFDARLSVTEWWRPALWSALAVIARHAVVRHQPVPKRVAAGVIAWWRSPDTRMVLPIHLASRLGVLAIGFLAVILIGFPPQASSRWTIYSNELLDLPARWDTGWYLTIANEGYLYRPHATAADQQNIAFFPAFPMSIRYLSAVLGRQPLWTGVAISIVAFYFALLYFLRLARSELGHDDQAVAAMMLIAAYPFAVFFSAAYTEALFLLTLVGAVYHFRHDQLWRSAVWGFLCGLTRPPGCLLSVVLGLMALGPLWDRWRRRAIVPSAFARSVSAGQPAIGWRAIGARLLAASAPGLGMLAFSAFIYRLTGNPFQWTMQNAAWGRVYRRLDSIVLDRIDFIATNGFYAYASQQATDLFYSLAVILCLAAVWPVYRRFGLPYAVFIILNLLPPMSAGGMLSMGRVTSVLFPVFLWLGAAVPPHQRTAWIVGFAMLQGLVAAMFFTWRPLY